MGKRSQRGKRKREAGGDRNKGWERSMMKEKQGEWGRESRGRGGKKKREEKRDRQKTRRPALEALIMWSAGHCANGFTGTILLSLDTDSMQQVFLTQFPEVNSVSLGQFWIFSPRKPHYSFLEVEYTLVNPINPRTHNLVVACKPERSSWRSKQLCCKSMVYFTSLSLTINEG